MNVTKATLLFFKLFLYMLLVKGQDTITVQTFTFGSPQDAWFQFPADTVAFEKILMQYTLKCNPAQNPACGEWDYLTYTYLYDHTGLTDSSVVHQPCFLLNGNVPDSLVFSLTPTWQSSGHWEYFPVYDDTLSLSVLTIGSNASAMPQPFGASEPVSRSVYLWKASELIAQGLVAGNISGMRLYANSFGHELRNLCIRIKQTTDDTLSATASDLNGMTEVFRRDHSQTIGWSSLQFLQPFVWDGSSNLMIEISFQNNNTGSDWMMASYDAGFKSGLHAAGHNRYAWFRGGGFIPVHVTDTLNSVDSSLSVSFRAFGNPAYQPQSGTCFEGVNTASNRVLNAHVPWSNLGVYWDAGNDAGSYDRINKTATTSETEGQWHRWVMTKNAVSGNMKIYLDGALWHSGTGFTRLFDSIASFRIGKGNWSGSESYEGGIDDFAVFSCELSAQEVADWSQRDINQTHPQFDKLVMHFCFDEGNHATVTDSAAGNTIPSGLAGVSNPLLAPEDYSSFTETTFRPYAAFEQGNFLWHTDSLWINDTIQLTPMQIVYLTDSLLHPGDPVDTLMVWPAGFYRYLYNASGLAYDSVYVSPDSIRYQQYYDYFQYFPQVIRYELARYITPYGNGLSLGDGWTWTFDVSDYRTLLADSVHLAAGNWQELLDMKFLMIKGTPPRNVLSIQNLWNGGFNYGDAANPIDTWLTERKVLIPSNAAAARWKSRITGHGMDSPENCAEFCAKFHYFLVDSVQRFSRLVWRDNCDLNPLYPQGGTWVYDRANWCPGAEVWTYDFELTPYVSAGDTALLDHNVQAYVHSSGWDYFQIEDQLVTYGAPNFTLDAAIDQVLAPTTDLMWLRLNPICTAPVIVIRNTGSSTLTSLDIDYGIYGTSLSTYHWTGNLDFMETEQVELDTFAWGQGASEFIITLKNPNGGNDQYAPNNTRITAFEYVPVMPEKFVILLKTNNNPAENSYVLSDDMGNVIFERSNLAANTTYSDTMNLGTGCYQFRLSDTGEDGLSFWANTSQGSGYIKFKSATNNIFLFNFGADFGGEVYRQFTVGLTSNNEELSFTDVPMLKVYPNPAEEQIMVDFNLPQRSDGLLQIYDMMGHTVYVHAFQDVPADSRSIDVSGFPGGVYLVTVHTSEYMLTRRVVIR